MEILTGIIAGIVSGLGMGGGSILILILVSIIGIDQHVAQATNLIFFIPTALVAVFVNWKQKLINFKIGIFIAGVGMAGALVGAGISTKIDSFNLRRYFGVFLIIIAFYEIYRMYKEYKNKKNRNNIKD